MRMILLGGPGAGKGTQAQKLSEKYNAQHIATGDMLRQAVKDETEMGSMAKSYMDKGQLVPDEVVIGIVKDRLSQSDAEAGFVFDGFPRTVPQAQALDELIDELNMPLDAVVNIDTSAEVVIERLSGRRTCRGCQKVYHVTYSAPKEAGICDECGDELYHRDDDKEETIRKRLKVYEEQTAPLLDYYRDSGKMIVVSGDDTIDEVSDAICYSLWKLV